MRVLTLFLVYLCQCLLLCCAPSSANAYSWSGFASPFTTSVDSCSAVVSGLEQQLQLDNPQTWTLLSLNCTDPYPITIATSFLRGDGSYFNNQLTSLNTACPAPKIFDLPTGRCACPPNTFLKPSKGICGAATAITTPLSSTPDNNGGQCPKCAVGDQINPALGNNWRTETDYATRIPGDGLSFTRSYNSNIFSTDAGLLRSIGAQWTHNFDLAAVPIPNPYQTSATAPNCFRWDDDQQIFCTAVTSAPDMNGISFIRTDGKSYSFGLVGSTWVGTGNTSDRVTASHATDGVTITGWTFVAANGDQTEQYDNSGRLLSITARTGATQTMTYSNGVSNNSSLGRIPAAAPICPNVEAGPLLPAGFLLCVTDNWGHQLQFEYDAQKRISKMIDPSNQSTLYAYDGPSGGCMASTNGNPTPACSANNLTQVTYPDGAIKTYWYNEAAHINGGVACVGDPGVEYQFGNFLNALSSIVDENSARYTSWDYDCVGRAVASQFIGGLKKTTLSYGTPNPTTGASVTTLTDYVGTSTSPQSNVHNFNFQIINGVAKILRTDTPCTECGPVASYTYDTNGNVASSTDFNGVVTTYQYDLTRNLETSRIEATGTALARTISTSWHAVYRQPLKIAAPLLLTTYTYDAAGNRLTTTLQATTDTTGAAGLSPTTTGVARTWSYTYNSVGQVLTATGPRTDVASTVTYTYDSNGNLSTVTNASGLLTTLSGYDANGRVGLITDPNGASTALSYTPRGWLASKITTAGGALQSTSYSYDYVGQLTQVSLPDNSTLNLTYDNAHRLTDVTDSLGNSIHYTLDLWGNRIGETASDPANLLNRQINRLYDTVNRLQQVTGGVQ